MYAPVPETAPRTTQDRMPALEQPAVVDAPWAMSRIELRAVSKVYPPDIVAVDGIDLSVDDGEVLVLLGPTGSGKSTVLRLIAGLETPTSGEIRFDDERLDDALARDRGVAMVFQDYALYPHLTVAENVGFPLRHLDEAAR